MNAFLVRVFVSVLLVCALSACPETNVGPDFGYKCVVLKSAEWNGDWQIFGEEGAVRFDVIDGPNGQISIAEITDPKDKKDKADMPTLLTLRHASKDKDNKPVQFSF